MTINKQLAKTITPCFFIALKQFTASNEYKTGPVLPCKAKRL